jgi:prophage regulatory protein
MADMSAAPSVKGQPLQAAQIPDALLKQPTVSAVTGLSASTINRKVAAGEFPQPIKLGKRCTRWRAGAVTAWLAAQGSKASA